MTNTSRQSAYKWLVPDEAMARHILRACAAGPFARSYFANALRNGLSHEAISNTLQYVTVRQKLAWMGSAYLEGLLIEYKRLAPDVADKVRAREQKRRNKYNSLVANARKALAAKANKANQYVNVVKAFNVEGQTSIRRVWQLVGDYTATTYMILAELGELELPD
jgi:hypothetical protein